MSEDCENLKFLYLDCVRNINLNENMPRRCFQFWDELIKCVNTDINDLKKMTLKSETQSSSVSQMQNERNEFRSRFERERI